MFLLRCLLLVVCLAAMGCSKDCEEPVEPPRGPLLKELVLSGLPSPWYGFTYNAQGRPTGLEWSSGMRKYRMQYEGGRLVTMEQVAPANGVRLVYEYDPSGKPFHVKVFDAAGQVVERAFLDYNLRNQLVEVEWELKGEVTGFETAQILRFAYYPDGNLEELHDQRRTIAGKQDAAEYFDHYEQYDTGVNVDAFSLLHPQGRHPLLLAATSLQRNNPGKVTRTGTGVGYTISYTYTYGAEDRPVSRTGNMQLENGQQVQLRAAYSYY